MAIIYDAELNPTKTQALVMLLEKMPWFSGDAQGIELVAHYRFDDPDGKVGIECHLVRDADGGWLHLPVAYRDSEVPELQEFLVTPMQHSELGQRYVYDGSADPVVVAALARGAASQQPQAQEESPDGDLLDPGAQVGPGGSDGGQQVSSAGGLRVERREDVTIARAQDWSVEILHRPHESMLAASEEGEVLTGRWEGLQAPAVLVRLQRGERTS